MDYRAKIESIRYRFLKGEISRDEAKALIMPMLVEMNKKGAAIAKKFGRKFYPLTFGYVFR